MTSEIIKRMFDACYQAKRTRDMLPPLPEGVRASFIQYLDVIRSDERERCAAFSSMPPPESENSSHNKVPLQSPEYTAHDSQPEAGLPSSGIRNRY